MRVWGPQVQVLDFILEMGQLPKKPLGTANISGFAVPWSAPISPINSPVAWILGEELNVLLGDLGKNMTNPFLVLCSLHAP